MRHKPEFTDTLSSYIARIEKAEKNSKKGLRAGIITSHDLRIAPLSGGPVKREQIAWRLYQHYMAYVVTVAPGTEVEKHSHDEDIFRYVIDGSLTVDDGESKREIRKGMWFVVRAGTPYQIKTEKGYQALLNYRNTCIPM